MLNVAVAALDDVATIVVGVVGADTSLPMSDPRRSRCPR